MVTMTRARLVLTSALASALLPWGAAHGYVRTRTSTGHPMFWENTCQRIVAYTGDPPAYTRPGDLLAAATAAATAWGPETIACSALSIAVSSHGEASAMIGNDGVNRITFRRQQWCPEPREPDEACYDEAAIALTTVSARTRDGAILDADVEINAVKYRWADMAAQPQTGAHDLQNTLTHELGHFIGLDHTCLPRGIGARGTDNNGIPVPDCSAASIEVRETTMYPSVFSGDLVRRTPEADDQLAVCEIYAGDPRICQPIGGESGCECSAIGVPSRQPRVLVWILATIGFVVATGSRRRRGRGRR